jgi:hypothetical protein
VHASNLVLDVAQVGEKPTVRAQLLVESAGGVQALPELLLHSKSNVARHRQTWWCLVDRLALDTRQHPVAIELRRANRRGAGGQPALRARAPAMAAGCQLQRRPAAVWCENERSLLDCLQLMRARRIQSSATAERSHRGAAADSRPGQKLLWNPTVTARGSTMTVNGWARLCA